MKLPEEQKKAIEQEAEELWPERLFPSGAQRRAYAHGATTRAIICQQKDEEIARLRKKIQEIDNMAQGNVPVSFWKIHLVCEEALNPIVNDQNAKTGSIQ